MNERTPVPLPPIPDGCGILPVAENRIQHGPQGDWIGEASAPAIHTATLAPPIGAPAALADGGTAADLASDPLEVRSRRVLARALALCAGALLTTSAVSASLVHNSAMEQNPAGLMLAKGFFLFQILVLAFCSRFVQRLSIGIAAVLLFAYAAFCGLEFSILLPPAALAVAFLCAGLMYGATALWGYVRGCDLAHPAAPMLMILGGGPMLVAVNRLFEMPRLSWSISSIAIAVFAALAGFHAQQIRDFYQDFDDDNREGWKASVVGALLLLLNSVNLYLLVASIGVQLARFFSDDDDGHHDCLPN